MKSIVNTMQKVPVSFTGEMVDPEAFAVVRGAIVDPTKVAVCFRNPIDNTIELTMLVTPEQADLWKVAPNCRTTNGIRVATMAEQLRQDKWELSCARILFNSSLERIGGMHTCAAIVLANTPAWCHVFFGCPDRVQSVSNYAKAWAPSDNIGGDNRTRRAAIARVLWSLESGQARGGTNLLDEDLKDILGRYDDHIEAIRQMCTSDQTLGRRADIQGALVYARPVLQPLVDDCARVLRAAAPESESDRRWVPLITVLSKALRGYARRKESQVGLSLRSYVFNALVACDESRVGTHVKPFGEGSKLYIDKLRRKSGLITPDYSTDFSIYCRGTSE